MMTLEEQVRELAVLRATKEETAKAADDAKRAYDKAHAKLWDRMDGSGVGSVTIDGKLYSFNKPKVYGTVADKAALYRWAVEEGNAPELFEPDAREGLINERARQCIDNGEPLPPGMNFYTKNVVSQRKARS